MIRSSSSTQTEPESRATGERIAEWREYSPPVEGEDDVSRAKLNLLQLAARSDREPPGMVNSHPYAFVAGALAAGFLVGRVPFLRSVFIKAASWGATSYAQRALRQWMG